MIGSTLGHYQILDQLGRGGMGEVYRAHDVKLDRTVALKFIRADLLGDPEIRRRFLGEARALAAMDHPYIGTVHGFEEIEDRHFMVLAFVEGQALNELLRSGPLPPGRAAALLPRIAEGLEAAHRRGVVHRDVKSSNILVDAGDVPRLVDFGLALREGDTRVTRQDGTVVGTIEFMAPEVVRGEHASPHSDQFSLGVVLYQALTGHLPFQGTQVAAVLHSILELEPLPFPGSLSRESLLLEPVVRRCLEKDPGLRFPDVGAVASALRMEAATVVGVGRSRPAAARTPLQASSVAVLDFENLGGDPSLDWMQRGLAELLGTALFSSEELDVYDAQRLTSLTTPGDTSGPSDAMASLRRAGIGRAVVGSVLGAGGRLRIQGRVLDVESGRVLLSHSVDGGAGDDLFELAGRLISGLQTSLEVDLIGLRTGDQWLRDITTSSVEAYRLFLDGRKAFIGSRWAEAAAEYERALALDGEFVAARIDLAGCYWNTGQEELLSASLAEAGRLRGRASRREALQLDLIEAVIHEDSSRLVRVATDLSGLYPENRFFVYLRGRGHFTSREFARCLEVLEPLAAERYEWAWTYLLMARSHEELGQHDRAIRAYELGMDVTGSDPELGHSFAMLLAERGDRERARALLEAAAQSPRRMNKPQLETLIQEELRRLGH